MYTTNKSTKSIADAALKVMMGEAKSPAQQAAIAIAMKEKGQKPKEEMKEAKLHPNQQKLDVHEPEKDELTAKDFEMLRKGKKAPQTVKEEDAYEKDRYAVKNGKAIKDNPSHMGSANYKDQPHHVWATSAEEALKKKKVSEGTIAGDILKKIDEMKTPWPGTPEYKKMFPPKEMKPGEEKATKTGVVKKTIKGVIHTARPMKEEVEVKQQQEVKVLAKEEVSFQNLINLYMDNGVESLIKTVEKIKEEASNDEFHKEVEENKKKAEGKVEQPKVAEPSVKAVKVTKEEVEQIDELDKSTLASYVKKASHDVAAKGAATRQFANDSEAARKREDYSEARKKMQMADKTFAKSWKRREGMAKAVDKLAKEEVEQVDEQLNERSMTEPEMKKREEIVKGMKKNLAGFKERYGEKAKSVMYATATKQAMKD